MLSDMDHFVNILCHPADVSWYKTSTAMASKSASDIFKFDSLTWQKFTSIFCPTLKAGLDSFLHY